jgi:hypothetical protein
MFLSCIGMSLAVGTAGLVAADGGATSGGPASGGAIVVQSASQPRIVSPGAQGRPTVRRYRSYSIDPGVAGSTGAVEATPGVVRPSPSVGRPAKPSYMRGDAKARGHFHR